MKNYICIDGKKAELTEEQLKALGIEIPKISPFERVVNHTTNDFYSYYFIDPAGEVAEAIDNGFSCGNGSADLRYRTANYCTDKSIMEQRALHETLNRLLWRYSMEHKEDSVDNKVWSIEYDPGKKEFCPGWTYSKKLFLGEVTFSTMETAQNAIKEVAEPFMAAHPNFKLYY